MVVNAAFKVLELLLKLLFSLTPAISRNVDELLDAAVIEPERGKLLFLMLAATLGGAFHI